MRVAAEGGGVEVDFGEEGFEAGGEAFGRALVMDGEGFGEDLADRHAGVEGGVGVLEDDGDVAAEAAELEGGGGVGWVVEDMAAGGLDEAEEDAGEGGLAGAGFADEAEGLAAGEGEGDVVEDAVGAVVLGEVCGGEKHRDRD